MIEQRSTDGEGGLLSRWRADEDRRLEDFIEAEVARRVAAVEERIRSEERKRVMHRVFDWLMYHPVFFTRSGDPLTDASTVGTYRSAARAVERGLRKAYRERQFRPEVAEVAELRPRDAAAAG